MMNIIAYILVGAVMAAGSAARAGRALHPVETVVLIALWPMFLVVTILTGGWAR